MSPLIADKLLLRAVNCDQQMGTNLVGEYCSHQISPGDPKRGQSTVSEGNSDVNGDISARIFRSPSKRLPNFHLTRITASIMLTNEVNSTG
jgi:hypothetical protein